MNQVLENKTVFNTIGLLYSEFGKHTGEQVLYSIQRTDFALDVNTLSNKGNLLITGGRGFKGFLIERIIALAKI